MIFGKKNVNFGTFFWRYICQPLCEPLRGTLLS